MTVQKSTNAPDSTDNLDKDLRDILDWIESKGEDVIIQDIKRVVLREALAVKPIVRDMADMRGLGQIGNEGFNEALHAYESALRKRFGEDVNNKDDK